MTISKEEYAEYLQSEDWWERRTLVVERANGRCEGCRKAEAVDVHHLSYEHVTAEFLFELVALCAACHERIHGGPGTSPKAEKRQGWQRRKTEGERWRAGVDAALNKYQGPVRSNLPGAQWRRARLVQLAAEHRARTMAKGEEDAA